MHLGTPWGAAGLVGIGRDPPPRLAVWRARDRLTLTSLVGPESTAYASALDVVGDLAVVGLSDGRLLGWDLAAARLAWTVDDAFDGLVTGVALVPDGSDWFLAAAAGPRVRAYRLAAGGVPGGR